MGFTIGIRREDKNRWEKRVPLIPDHIKKLKENHGVETIIQPSHIRTFSDREYLATGAVVNEDLSRCSIVFSVKEMPLDFFEPGKTYVFFSHTVKGQKHNMPMLKRMMDLGCTLIDYEKIADNKDRRLVFFGRFAGLAGMVDTLWIFGQRLHWEHIPTPFIDVKQTIRYKNLDDSKEQLADIGTTIKRHGLPKSLTPLIVGFAGYGNVSKGAQEILDILPVQEISPAELPSVSKTPSRTTLYKVVFKEEDMVKPISPTKRFDLQEYYSHPENYKPVFEHSIPYLSILMNCIYWNVQYPRLVTKDFLKKNYGKQLHLKVIGDISVDINGAIECTEKTTSTDNPTFVYNPVTGRIRDGYRGEGIVVMAVDNLPCELPQESSQTFSHTLVRFIPDIVHADFLEEDFDKVALPPEIKKAVILYHGQFTPNYTYINKFL